MRENYEPMFQSLLNEATAIQSLKAWPSCFTRMRLEWMDRRRKHPGPRSFYSLATKLGIMSDASSGIPRTAYKGVVTVYYSGIRVFLVPEGGMSATYKCDLFL